MFRNSKGEERVYKEGDEKELWDGLIYLKIKCGSVDVEAALAHVEGMMGD